MTGIGMRRAARIGAQKDHRRSQQLCDRAITVVQLIGRSLAKAAHGVRAALKHSRAVELHSFERTGDGLGVPPSRSTARHRSAPNFAWL